MADETAADTQVTATVTVALSGSPLDGLRIVADGALVDSPADWSSEYAAAGSALNDRVLATIRNPTRPIVTGTVQDGAA